MMWINVIKIEDSGKSSYTLYQNIINRGRKNDFRY